MQSFLWVIVISFCHSGLDPEPADDTAEAKEMTTGLCSCFILLCVGYNYFTDMQTINDISLIMKLTPYQAYVLAANGDQYDLSRIKKRGSVILVPHKCNLTESFKDGVAQVLYGKKHDLIGPDRMLATNVRSIRLYPSGMYKTRDANGHTCYADNLGRRLSYDEFSDLSR
ncbi:hypothetical protein FACS18945_3740 [Bacteroidia bacterium]|nr:hypothetical protein FACS18945_3740 [Bacteroidia bacterium]